jgi:predicted component of type VI protein secretion system
MKELSSENRAFVGWDSHTFSDEMQMMGVRNKMQVNKGVPI